MKYRYGQGNLLDERNTYFYSAFEGADFLNAWLEDREISTVPSKILPLEKESKQTLFQEIFNELPQKEFRAKKLVQRFEVTKRIFDSYRDNFTAEDKHAFRNIENYIDAATIFSRGYETTKDLVYLNALLKIMDTISSMRQQLAGEARADYALLCLREKNYIIELANSLNSTWRAK